LYLHHWNHNDSNDTENDEINPPEALAVSSASTVLGLDPILRLGHFVLLRHDELPIVKGLPLNKQKGEGKGEYKMSSSEEKSGTQLWK
jgi:hypothetical protein